MKIRNGFVSNSSSSSFVCEICHTAEVLSDGGLEEINFCECTNGHLICIDHLLDQNAERDEDGMLSNEACPICQLKDMPDYLFVEYMEKRTGITKKDALKDIKCRCKNWNEFIKYLNSK